MKYRYGLLGAFCMLFLSTGAWAAAPYDDIDVVYINGIWNFQRDAAADSMEILKEQLKGAAPSVTYLYNRGDGVVQDVWELAKQSANDGGRQAAKDFIRWTKNPDSAPTWVRDKLFDVQYFDAQALATNPDLRSMISKLEFRGSTRKKVLLVCHSQGNLFCNQIYHAFQNDATLSLKDCIGHVGVAVPATNISGKTSAEVFPQVLPYVTKKNDVAVNLARVIMPFGNKILSGNVGPVDTGLDFLEHSFESYMGYPGLSQAHIVPFMNTVAKALNTSCVAPIPCGTPVKVRDDSFSAEPNGSNFRGTKEWTFKVGNKRRVADWAMMALDSTPEDWIYGEAYDGTTRIWRSTNQFDAARSGWSDGATMVFDSPSTRTLALRITAETHFCSGGPCQMHGPVVCMQCWEPGLETCDQWVNANWIEPAPPPPPPPVTRNVSIGYGWQSQTSSWVCQARNVTIDGTNYGTWGRQSVLLNLAIGTHTLTADASCTCTATLGCTFPVTHTFGATCLECATTRNQSFPASRNMSVSFPID